MAARGCGGSRTEGGIYLVTKLVRGGTPLREFLLDPPVPVPDELNLPARGVVIRERPDGSGIHDVWDHVGSNHYPNMYDFICEVGNLGLSRHVSSKIDFNLITKDSLIILAHERAVLKNAEALYQFLAAEAMDYPEPLHSCLTVFPCPTTLRNPGHKHLIQDVYAGRMGKGAPCCLGHGIQLLTGGEDVLDPALHPRQVSRTVGSTTYQGYKKPKDFTPEYERGFFMALPLSGIEVVAGGENDDLAIERASASGLDVELVDE